MRAGVGEDRRNQPLSKIDRRRCSTLYRGHEVAPFSTVAFILRKGVLMRKTYRVHRNLCWRDDRRRS